MNHQNTWAEWSRPDLQPAIKANRYDDAKGNRFYYFLDEGRVTTAAGITTWLGKVMPESKFLTDWKIKYGKDYVEVLNITADYGTALHAMFAHILINRTYPDELSIKTAEESLSRLRKWDGSIPKDQVRKDLASFIQWTLDYKVKPLMVEAILPCHTDRGTWYAMTADLPCELTYIEKREVQEGELKTGPNKGQPKMVKKEFEVKKTVAVDFKSNPFGKESKSFFDSHLMQLLGVRKAMKQNFGIEVEELYNWSPDNWRTSPKYTFHKWNFTDKHVREYEILEQLAELKGFMTPEGKIWKWKEWTADKPGEPLFEILTYEEEVLRGIQVN